MRKNLDLRKHLLTGSFSLVLALVLFAAGFSAASFVSHAESQGKITAASVNIRKEPSTTSAVVASTERDKTVSIVSQEKGADGYTWYKVYVDANTMGYIRADLLTITDGSTPPASTSNPGTPSANETPSPGSDPGSSEEPVQMTEVYPVSATVIGDSVKILDAASTGAQEVAQVQTGTALTVTGHGTDASEVIWYQVSFISNETQVSGYVQSVYVNLSEDLTPVTEEPPQNNVPEEPTEPAEPPKQYETIYKDDKWLVYNIDKPEEGYPIESLIEASQKNASLYEDSQKTVKNQKLIIIILVFLLVAAVAGIAFLVFKVRDMMDSAYFNEVENETLRKRSAAGTGGSQSGRVMHSVGTDKQAARPSGTRPAGGSQGQREAGTSQGQRPSGGSQSQRPGASQGQRPAGTMQRQAGPSQGQRPEGVPQGQRTSLSQSQRPAGTSQGQRQTGGSQGQRPEGVSQGQRPVSSSQRPAGSPQGQRQTGTVQGQRTDSQRPAGNPQGARPVQGSSQKAQSQPRNFMADDEEFEFEFLNYDGDDEK